MVQITHKCKYLEKEIACLKMIRFRVHTFKNDQNHATRRDTYLLVIGRNPIKIIIILFCYVLIVLLFKVILLQVDR